MTKSKFNAIVGSIGAFIGIFVFISYIPQIIANLNGAKRKDYILIAPNLAGVILGTITFLTAL